MCLIAATLVMAAQAGAPLVAQTADAAGRRPAAGYGSLPLGFMANQGQSAEPVKFLARGSGYSLFLTPTEVVLSLRGPSQSTAIVRMRLVGANTHPQLTGLDALPGTSNYFVGNDPARWQRDVPTYARVKYTGVYPGIDQIYYGNQRQLEYDLVVAPNADPRRIMLAFDGLREISLDNEGNLVLETSQGDIKQHKPVIYQDIGGRRQPVDGHYVLRGRDRVGFHIAGYDRTRPLVIDPVVSYSTYLGGNSNDVGNAIAVDGAGDVYITGETYSTNFPGVAAGFQSAKSTGYDVFVTKLNAAGTAVVYSTYLGGSGADFGEAIAVDSTGSAYLTGQTDSPTAPGSSNIPFPTTAGAVQPVYHLGPGDAFVTKLNASGNALVYSTYLGGNGVEKGYGIAVDSSGNAYVTGYTNAVNSPGGLQNFPTVGAFQAQNASFSYDAFVSKLNASGSAFVYSTFLGGDANEFSIYGGAIAVDNAGNAYVGGSTASLNFPGASASTIQPANGGGFVDGFVVKFNAAGSGLVYSTYLGGTGYDEVNGLAIDSGGNAYVAGYTNSSNFPTVSPLQAARNGSGSDGDAFVSRIDAAGSALVYSTYLGGGGNDIAFDVAVDSASNAYIAGWTNSSNFPTMAPLQAVNHGSGGDAFISELNAAGSALVSSTYWGGSTGWEYAYGIALDALGHVFITGETNSDEFPTASAFQPTYASHALGPDAFVLKIAPQPPVLRPPTNLLASSVAGNTVTLNWTAPADSITPTGYVLEGGVSPGQVLASMPTGSTATTFTFSAPTGAFYLRMHSMAAATKSVASNEIRVFVNVPAPPSAPANLLGAVINDRDVSLAWINTAAGGTPTALTLDVTGTLAVSMSLPVTDAFSFASVPNGTYTFSLRASNSAGVSASSNSVTLTFPGPCSGVPGTPTSFQVIKSGNVISASWSLPASGPAPTGYTLIVTGGFTGSFAVSGRSISGAVGPGSYTLSVAATNACGTSAASASQTVTIP